MFLEQIGVIPIMKSSDLIFYSFLTVPHHLFICLLTLSCLHQNKKYLISSYLHLWIVCIDLHMTGLSKLFWRSG